MDLSAHKLCMSGSFYILELLGHEERRYRGDKNYFIVMIKMTGQKVWMAFFFVRISFLLLTFNYLYRKYALTQFDGIWNEQSWMYIHLLNKVKRTCKTQSDASIKSKNLSISP